MPERLKQRTIDAAVGTPARVREDASAVASAARHVAIDDAELDAIADRLSTAVVPTWDHDLHFFDGTEKSVMYTLLLDAVNFCFWPSAFSVDHRGRRYGDDDGYCALAVALKRAFEDGVPLWEPGFLASLDRAGLAHVLRGEGEVPLLEERLANARDVGTTMLTRYDGDVRRLIEASRGDAAAFAAELSANFRAYDDHRLWRGRRVEIMKRSQLCASDLAGSFGGKGVGALAGADALTCFADYKLPQLFRSEGAFAYDAPLDARIRALEEVPAGSEEEVEIRACTIEAVERLKALLAARGRRLQAREIDWLLWNESIVPGRLTEPHHRTITTSY